MAQQDERQELSREELSRRSFLQQAALGTAVVAGIAHHVGAADEKKQASVKVDFPVVDYHVHLSGALTIEKAVALASTRGVKFGIVEHPAPEGKLADDSVLRQYLDLLKKYPVYRGMQPVYPHWAKAFSKELLGQLDYILMDALTLPETNGGWLAIWRADTVVTDKQAFMTRYLEFIVRVLTEEPIDIFAWPTYLPACISQDYDVLWTAARLQKLVDLAVKKDIAIEINEFAQVPKARFINMAKEAGLRFTFGTDSRDERAGKFEYCLQMAKQCGLTEKNMFTPKPDGQKAIQRSPKA
jgi:histidinol phosphatase-like PHP family hydrolase